MKKYKAAIIGGGFSGLVAAIKLSENLGGSEVVVLEKNDRTGKKIVATGNGRGNITNLELSKNNYHSVGGGENFIAVEKYGNKSIISFFSSLGVAVCAEGNRVYPSSMQASSLLDMMRLKLGYLKTEIRTSSECLEIKPQNHGFILKTADGDFFAERVVFAAGGKAGKQYGTDGTAFALLQKLGVKVTELYPAIVQLKTDTDYIKGLKNLKEKASVSAYDGDKFLKSFYGDVLFTDYGVSGNATFYLSSYLIGARNPALKIEFTDKTESDLYEFLVEKVKNLPYITADDLLTGVVNKQIGRAIVKRSGAGDTSPESLKKIAETAKNFNLNVRGTLGFDYAQVTRGGVSCKELDENFECKKIKGLFVTGEATDVDGDCGGYNLQWAFSSAMVAADKIIEESADNKGKNKEK